MTEHRVDVGDVVLHVEEQGNGPPVVLAHGMLCSGRMFDAVAADLAADHRVLNVDLRGHGRSGVPAGGWSLDRLADDLAAVLDARETGPAAVVGFSLGGMAALRLALRRPDRVRALALLDTSAQREDLVRRLRFHALAAVASRVGMRPWLLREAAKAMFSAPFRRSDPEAVAAWTRGIAEMDLPSAVAAVRMVAERPSVLDRLGEVRVPALVVVADRDANTPPSHARALAAALPDARLEVIAVAGHGTPVERPAEVVRLVRGLLGRVEGSGAATR